MHDHQFASRIQVNSLWPPVEDLKSDFFLIGLQPPLDGRWGQREVICCSPDRAGSGDGIDDPECGEVFHINTLGRCMILSNTLWKK